MATLAPTPPTSTTTTAAATTTTNEVTVVDGEATGWNAGESFTDLDLYLQHGLVTGIKVGTGSWINSIQAKYKHSAVWIEDWSDLPLFFRYGQTWGPVHGSNDSNANYMFDPPAGFIADISGNHNHNHQPILLNTQ